ncbi:MAG: DUF6199 family natural product biosynthesis protein [Acutalibacteraceae bacterium]
MIILDFLGEIIIKAILSGIFIAIGLFIIKKPEYMWDSFEKWKSSDSKNRPSNDYLNTIFIRGLLFIIVGIIVIFI